MHVAHNSWRNDFDSETFLTSPLYETSWEPLCNPSLPLQASTTAQTQTCSMFKRLFSHLSASAKRPHSCCFLESFHSSGSSHNHHKRGAAQNHLLAFPREVESPDSVVVHMGCMGHIRGYQGRFHLSVYIPLGLVEQCWGLRSLPPRSPLTSKLLAISSARTWPACNLSELHSTRICVPNWANTATVGHLL